MNMTEIETTSSVELGKGINNFFPACPPPAGWERIFKKLLRNKIC